MVNRLLLRNLSRVLAIVWTIIILIGCTLPAPDVPPVMSMHDKFMHVVIFVPFSLLWRLSGRSLGWAIVAGLMYGIVIEVVQGLFPGLHRNADLEDVVADFMGTLIGVGLAWAAERVLKV